MPFSAKIREAIEPASFNPSEGFPINPVAMASLTDMTTNTVTPIKQRLVPQSVINYSVATTYNGADVTFDLVVPKAFEDIGLPAYFHFAGVLELRGMKWTEVSMDAGRCVADAWYNVSPMQRDSKLGFYNCMMELGGKLVRDCVNVAVKIKLEFSSYQSLEWIWTGVATGQALRDRTETTDTLENEGVASVEEWSLLDEESFDSVGSKLD